MYVVCVCVRVCVHACFTASKVAHTVCYCNVLYKRQSIFSPIVMVIARWASAHFSQVSLPRTAVRWTTALSSGYSSPILSTWSYAVTRHP